MSENSPVSRASSTVLEDNSSEKSTGESKTESGKDESSEISEDSVISDTDAKKLTEKSFINMVKDGTYYLKMTVDLSSLGVNSTDTDEDIPESITMTTAMDAKNQRIYMDFGYSLGGFNKIIIANGKQWMISDENKIAYYMTTTTAVDSQLESITGSAFETDNLKYLSADEKEFNGKPSIAVVYNVPSNINATSDLSASTSGFDTEQTYYFDKETEALVGIKVDAGSTSQTIVIDELKSTIPSDLFDIPSDYTQQSLAANNSN